MNIDSGSLEAEVLNKPFREQAQRGSRMGMMIREGLGRNGGERSARGRVLRKLTVSGGAEQVYKDLFLFKCSGAYLKYRIC